MSRYYPRRAGGSRSADSGGMKPGFTLIELLVVIAIIAILAAILFPVFARARENARRSSCSSNLKQITLGIMQYKQDYDEFFPPGSYKYDGGIQPSWYIFASSSIYDRDVYWGQLVQPYIKSEDAFYCVSSPNRKGTLYQGTPSTSNYGITSWYVTNEYNANFAPMKDSAVRSPASKYMVFDAGFTVFPASRVRSPAGFADGGYFPGAGNCGADNTDCISGRHFQGANMGFADGHVKWLPTTKIYADAADLGSGPWNPMVD